MLALALAALLASTVDYEKKEIQMKVVYVATDEDAAHANLSYVYAKTSDGGTPPPPREKGKAKTYDFLPLALGEIRGFKTRFFLYTSLNGAEYAKERRTTILKDADGIIFVADKDPKRAAANAKQLAELKGDVAALGRKWEDVVVVYQAQSDGSIAGDTSAARKSLGLAGDAPLIEAVPATGTGVFDTLKAAAKATLMALRNSATGADAGR